MTVPANLLLLAGTREARMLAGALKDQGRWRVTASLAGVTSEPVDLAVETRRGGFGGVDGLVRYLQDNRFSAVVDATHPFAAQMSSNAAQACRRLELPLLRLERPAWSQPGRTGWLDVQDTDTAAAALPPGARAFLTVGGNSLEPFRCRGDVWFLIRTLEAIPGGFPFAQGTFVHGMPGTEAEVEAALMQEHGISHLVTKNAGGPAYAKVEAAVSLNIRTIMIARPQLPPAEIAGDVAAAMVWLEAL